MTKRAGVIGFPVGHSISPVFQQAAFDHLDLDVRYERWETSLAALPERIASLRDPGTLGANVTIPHKEAVLPLLDEIDRSARSIGAVNTIVNREGQLHGHNTDVTGLRAALEALAVDVSLGPAVVVGAGGAARGAVQMLLNAGQRRIWIANRSEERAHALADALRGWSSDEWSKLNSVGYDDPRYEEAVRGCRLLLNCTSVGMKGTGTEEFSPVDVDWLPKEAFIYDLVYVPAETTLVRTAGERGLKAANGLGMLIHQGAHAFRLWTGIDPPIDVMERAARGALGLPPTA